MRNHHGFESHGCFTKGLESPPPIRKLLKSNGFWVLSTKIVGATPVICSSHTSGVGEIAKPSATKQLATEGSIFAQNSSPIRTRNMS